MSRLARLLLPRSVAVVGGQPAALAIEQCRRLGFDGDLWAVHPRREEVAGVPCVPTVDDLPGVPDAVLVHVALVVVGDAGADVCPVGNTVTVQIVVT